MTPTSRAPGRPAWAVDGPIRLLRYRAEALVHWPARARALAAALDQVVQEQAPPVRRVVDVGCGPALAVPLVRQRGLRYLGMEPEGTTLAFCVRRFGRGEGVEFVHGAATDVAGLIAVDDCVVLNGVAHHLGDGDLDAFLRGVRPGAALIILDHWRTPGMFPVTRWLQDHDRGLHVRDAGFFAALQGFRLVGQRVFPIPCGVPLWQYFCNIYRPRRAEQP